MSLSIHAIVCGYLLGSIPSGYSIARAVSDVDPRLLFYLLALVPTIGVKKIMDLPRTRRGAEIHRRGRKQ